MIDQRADRLVVRCYRPPIAPFEPTDQAQVCSMHYVTVTPGVFDALDEAIWNILRECLFNGETAAATGGFAYKTTRRWLKKHP